LNTSKSKSDSTNGHAADPPKGGLDWPGYYAEVDRIALSQLDLLAELLPGGHVEGREYRCASINGDSGKSFAINLDSGTWTDFNGGQKGGKGLISLLARQRGSEYNKAGRELGQRLGIAEPVWNQIIPVPAAEIKQILDRNILPKWDGDWGKPKTAWLYRTKEGADIGFAVRFEKSGKNDTVEKNIIPLSWGRWGSGRVQWGWKSFAVPRPLYNLERYAKNPDAIVVVVEGEKCAEALQKLLDEQGITSHIVMTWPGGAKAVGNADWTPLYERLVIIWPDNDTDGLAAAARIARTLESVQQPITRNVYIVQPGELDREWPEGYDVADLINKDAWDAARILAFIDQKKRLVDDIEVLVHKQRRSAEKQQKPKGKHNKESKKEPTQADALIAIGQTAELFHDGDDCYATAEVDGHNETQAISGRGFRHWLLQSYFAAKQSSPNGEALIQARNTLCALAQFKGEDRKVSVRIARHENKIYLDLCNSSWQIVEISAEGWKVVESKNCPVRFRRTNGMEPLPAPESGGDIKDLRPFINCDSNDDDYVLAVGWLIGCFSEGPYPILVQQGEEGSAKSTRSRVFRDLIDPNRVALRSPPKEEGDILIAARHSLILAYDNLSHLPDWLSDSLCRLSTGAGLSKRELYTDSDEILLAAKQPILLTGIEELATHSDFLSRSIVQYLPFIDEEKRKTEKTFRADFELARPKLLGALLDAVTGALSEFDSVELARLPRMADFAKWVVAAEMYLDWDEGTFMRAYTGNSQAATDIALEASVIGLLVRDKLTLPFEGSATELLTALERLVSEEAKKSKSWPKSGRSAANHLRRIVHPLRKCGIVVEFDRTGEKRAISIRRVTPQDKGGTSSLSSFASSNAKNVGNLSLFSHKTVTQTNNVHRHACVTCVTETTQDASDDPETDRLAREDGWDPDGDEDE
jgi:putative DNA primase/helicase